MAHKNDGYWPGFVDALVNVVIAMVFVVVLLAISASMFGQLTVQFAAKRIAAQRLEEQKADLLPKADDASHGTSHDAPPLELESGDRIRENTRIVVKGGGNGARVNTVGSNGTAADASVRISVRSDSADFVFHKDVVQPEAKSLNAMKEALAPLVPKIQRSHAELRAFVSSGAVSDSRRSVFLRMLVVRNLLLEKGVAPDRISMKLEERDQLADQTRVRLVLQARRPSP